MAKPVIYNVTMTGSKVAHTFNDDTYAVVIQANGLAVQVSMENADTTYLTVANGASLAVNTRTIANQTWYFKAASGTAEIMEMRGIQ